MNLSLNTVSLNYTIKKRKQQSFFCDGQDQDQNLKIQPWMSFDLNGLKNGFAKYFENIVKSLQFF